MAPNLKYHMGIFLFYIFILFNSLSSVKSSKDSSSVYEILQKFGLPSGLLPDSVKSYSLSDDGSFVVELENPCYVNFDYLVYYDRRISGNLRVGSITDLDGIQVRGFFIWFDVDEIRVDLPPSDGIYFQVGLISKKLDVGQFKTVHSCQDRVQSWKTIFELPPPTDEIPMLITE